MNISKKKKGRGVVVGIFAHPDDEAFGPGGTLTKYSKDNDVYVICATRGEAGEGGKNLAKIREKELKESAKVLGIKKVFCLGFVDGTLSNSTYHLLAKKIESKLKILKPDLLITFEPLGISGHVDHITVSLVTTFVAQKLQTKPQILYYCTTDQAVSKMKDYFIYFPPGYAKRAIDKIVDIKDVWDIKLEAMYCHKSQMHDVKRILKIIKSLPKEEYFLTHVHR